MIDRMFQEGTDRTLDDQVARPQPVPFKQPGGFDGLLSAVPSGVGAGGLQMGAFGTEMMGAFGQFAERAATSLLPVSNENQRAYKEAAKAKPIEWSSPEGDALRTSARDIMPDPATTSTAANIVSGLAAFGGKALGYTMTLGPAAPFALGGDVGFEESDRLKQEGVDLSTRTKAGAVAGGLAALSVVAPMTGATKASRFIKGVTVGEGTMVGQSLAEKAILKAAGYQKQADAFDPLDPVSLALGVVPGALGAKFGRAAPKPAAEAPRPLLQMGLPERQALPYNSTALDAYAIQAAQREGIPPEILLAVKNAGEKSGSAATSPKGAQGVMQFMPETFKEFGKGDPTDPVNSIDAGAKYLKKLHDAYGDWDAAIAHYNGGGSEAAMVRSGGMPGKAETAAYLGRVRDYLGKTVDDHAAAAVKADPTLEAAARVQQAADALDASRLTRDDDLPGRDAHMSAVEMAADQIARGERVDVAPAFGDAMLGGMRESRLIDDHIAGLEGQRASLLSDAGNLLEPGAVRDLRAQIDTLKAAAPDTSPTATKARAREIQADDRVGYKQALAQATKEMEALSADHQASVQRLQDQLDTHGRAARAQEAMAPLDAAIEQARQQRDAMPGPRTSPRSMALAIADAFAQPKDRPARIPELARQPQEAAHVEDAPKAAGEGAATGEAAKPQGASEGGAGAAAPTGGVPEPGRPGDAQAPGLSQATVDRAAAEVSMLHPDMLVQLDGMESPMRVGDLLAKISDETAQKKKAAKLVDVAASCFIRTGSE